MAEVLTLTVPAGAVAATPRWLIKSLLVERGLVSNGAEISNDPTRSRIKVVLIGENGHTKSHEWTGAAADADIVALNKINLTVNSLNKRIIDKLIADGVIAGAGGGAPD